MPPFGEKSNISSVPSHEAARSKCGRWHERYAQPGSRADLREKPRSPLTSTLDIMRDDQWKNFFLASRDVLGQGANNSCLSESWCAWTTFQALKYGGIHYWTCGIPEYSEILDTHIQDGGLWGQPFYYDDLAHVIIPKTFYWETDGGPGFRNGTKTQDINALSERLAHQGIEHRITDLVLEIKLY